MEKLNNEELKRINGGLLKIAAARVLFRVGIALSFVVGLVNGYQNPLPCNK